MPAQTIELLAAKDSVSQEVRTQKAVQVATVFTA
jgi:hypothetical protein